jgi:hypothetical protein
VNGIPERNNLYGSIASNWAMAKLAELFEADGWTVRKCSATDYELSCPFAELVLERDHPVLLHGAVAEVGQNAQRIAAVLRKAGLTFSLECYAPDHRLLTEITQ